jgi:hypothetical protein
LTPTRPFLTSITYGDGKEVQASGVGTVLFKTLNQSKPILALHNVIWVPSQSFSLFSVKRASGHGGTTIYQDDKSLIYGEDFLLLESRPSSHSNYISEDQVIKFKNPESLLPPGFFMSGPCYNAMAARTKNESAALWHARFAHLSWPNMEKLVDGKLIRGLNVDP